MSVGHDHQSKRSYVNKWRDIRLLEIVTVTTNVVTISQDNLGMVTLE